MRNRFVFTIPMLLLLLTAITPFSAFAASDSTSSKSISQVTTEVTNPYDPAYQHSYRHGAVPTIEQLANIKAYQRTHATARVADAISSKTMVYYGGINGIGVTSGKEKVYLVFWGTQWGKKTIKNGNLTFAKDTAGAAPRLQNLFKGLGTGGEQWSGTMTQYCDGPKVKKGATNCPSSAAHVAYPTGGALAGVWYDNSAAEPQVVNGNQLAKEAIKAAGHFGNTTAASNRYAQYFIVSPPGTNPDNYKGNFCAWHDYNGDSSLSGGAASSHYGDIAFTNLPYLLEEGTSCGENFVNSGTAGKLDGFTITAGHEYAETITDQNAGGGWINASNTAENGDECAWITPGKQGSADNVKMGNGSYAMQSTWSNDTNECDLAHATIN